MWKSAASRWYFSPWLQASAPRATSTADVHPHPPFCLLTEPLDSTEVTQQGLTRPEVMCYRATAPGPASPSTLALPPRGVPLLPVCSHRIWLARVCLEVERARAHCNEQGFRLAGELFYSRPFTEHVRLCKLQLQTRIHHKDSFLP